MSDSDSYISEEEYYENNQYRENDWDSDDSAPYDKPVSRKNDTASGKRRSQSKHTRSFQDAMWSDEEERGYNTPWNRIHTQGPGDYTERARAFSSDSESFEDDVIEKRMQTKSSNIRQLRSGDRGVVRSRDHTEGPGDHTEGPGDHTRPRAFSSDSESFEVRRDKRRSDVDRGSHTRTKSGRGDARSRNKPTGQVHGEESHNHSANCIICAELQ